jgi:hypothetical protein
MSVRGNCMTTSSLEAVSVGQPRDKGGHKRSQPDRQRNFKLRFREYSE